jgi:hypothetical protein
MLIRISSLQFLDLAACQENHEVKVSPCCLLIDLTAALPAAPKV